MLASRYLFFLVFFVDSLSIGWSYKTFQMAPFVQMVPAVLWNIGFENDLVSATVWMVDTVRYINYKIYHIIILAMF